MGYSPATFRGNTAFLDADVKKELQITEEQAKKIQAALDVQAPWPFDRMPFAPSQRGDGIDAGSKKCPGRGSRLGGLGINSFMYLLAVKLSRILFWAALATGILGLLMPNLVPLWLALILAISCGLAFLYTALHVRQTRRFEWRCPHCGWVPFAMRAWKCKECGLVWDTFDTDGACPRCGHRHEETACLHCRRISPNGQWARSAEE